MANTYSQIYFHVVFSTKSRVDLIRSEIENRVWAYIGGIARKHKMTAIQVGGRASLGRTARGQRARGRRRSARLGAPG